MAEIAYILLCHKDPAGIVRQAVRLTAAGDYVAIHFDRRAAAADYRALRLALDANPRVAFARRRIRCGWGEWSLVAASLLAVRAAVAAFPQATHFYMMSGDCMPIKSAGFAHDYLDRDDCDYIETFDFFESDWIRTGIKEERLIYRHLFNERAHKGLFYSSMALQKRLGLARAIPGDLQIMIGSQWWCLRRRTVEKLLAFCDTRPDVIRFFRTTWIPDETFFQTIVHHLVPSREIRSRTLTFLMFTDYGMPTTFYNDHYDYLLSQDFLFARKISPEAGDLKNRLGALYGAQDASFDITGDGRRLLGFLTGRGRLGRRYAPRFWEAEAAIGQDRTLYIVACKKWHVAKRLVAKIADQTDIPVVEYLFSEEDARLPDLGGIETTLAKRGRHRRSLVRMLFEQFASDRLVICLDTSDYEVIRDFYADRATVRLLELQCTFSDDYLTGHAQRVGLSAANATAGTIARLLPTIRFDVSYESDRLGQANLPNVFRLRQAAGLDENAVALAQFLDIPADKARVIASADHLFAD
jgi:hypothetical protein